MKDCSDLTITIVRDDHSPIIEVLEPIIEVLEPNKQIKITHAFYGHDPIYLDVTFIVQQQNDVFTVNNQLFSDPCPGIIKELILIDQHDKHIIYSENDTVNLIDNHNLTTKSECNSVVKAIYGHGNRTIDVTKIVQMQKDNFRVTNQIFSDPCYGVVKELTITLQDGNCYCFPENKLVNINQFNLSYPNICL